MEGRRYAAIIARIIMQKTATELGQNVVIENRASANSNIGAELVAHASADGYTAPYNTSSIVFNMYIYPKLGYDTFRDFAPVTLTAVVPQVLVVIPALPDVPTLHESGMSKFEAGAWSGVLVPAKTPSAAINTLNAAILRALKDQGVVAQLERQGTMTLGKSGEEYGRYLRSEHERWGRIIREIGMK